MEEKSIKMVSTATKKAMIFIMLFAILTNIAFLYLMPIQDGIYSYNEHIVNNNHYGECPVGDCVYSEISNAFSCGIKFITSDYWFIESLCVTVICLLIIIISICYMCLTKSKFNITDTNICGKKGSKKFDIAFKDIVEIAQKGKSIIIKTKDKKLKLSPLKNCDEIYNHIKPNITEKPITQQVTSTVDDIKLF